MGWRRNSYFIRKSIIEDSWIKTTHCCTFFICRSRGVRFCLGSYFHISQCSVDGNGGYVRTQVKFLGRTRQWSLFKEKNNHSPSSPSIYSIYRLVFVFISNPVYHDVWVTSRYVEIQSNMEYTCTYIYLYLSYIFEYNVCVWF